MALCPYPSAPMNSETLQAISALIKIGSPRDPAPPQTLFWVLESVAPIILDLINTSLSAGVVPRSWKEAMVTPLSKNPSLDPDCFSNYRPISLLPGISKIAEKHMNSVLSSYLESHNLLHSTQMGFRTHQGTETALLAVIEDSKKKTLKQGALQP